MNPNSIPIKNLNPENIEILDKALEQIREVILSGQFILGSEVESFENEVANYLGVKYAVGVNSGTDALLIGIRALGIAEGDEIITTSYCPFPTVEAIHLAGATPVFVDIDPYTYNLDVSKIESKITSRTKGIIPVHLFGLPCEMDEIIKVSNKFGICVIEDTCQAFGGEYKGRKLGSLGNAGAISFFPTKNLGAFGDAGLLVTNDHKVYEKARMLRSHGSKRKYHNEITGYNSRMDAIQATILRVKLRYVDDWIESQIKKAHRYNQLLQGSSGIIIPAENNYTKHTFHQYTIRIQHNKRDILREILTTAEIYTEIYYPVIIPNLPVYSSQNNYDIYYPSATLLSQEALSIPIWPRISDDEQLRVIDVIKNAQI